MTVRIRYVCCLALALLAVTPGHGAAQGYPGYPDTIMAPEPGTARHHRAAAAAAAAPIRRPRASLLGHEKFVAKLHRGRSMFATRGSSGSVLPAPLPRTKLIPPERGGMPITHALPQEQGPTVVPGVANPVPNLPHGAETFQDRASRCAFQSGLYNVPGTARSQYMGGCVQ